jgi:hypothetical protein
VKRRGNERQDKALALRQAGLDFSSIAAKIERLDGDGCISVRMAQTLVRKASDRARLPPSSRREENPL